jgi:beta-phosphoglucomutase family hydrolase
MTHIKTIWAVLWDMDGVIADTAGYHFRSWQYAFKQQGVDFTEADFKRAFGLRNDSIIRLMLGNDLVPDRIDSIIRVKEEHFRAKARGQVKMFPGVLDLLTALQKEGIRAAIASSTPLENIQMLLKSLKIEGYFQAIVYGQEVSEGKPSPQIFLLAAQRVKAEPPNCVVIEDAVAGVAAAKRGGMHCIAVANTHTTGELASADLVVDSLEKVNIDTIAKLIRTKKLS